MHMKQQQKYCSYHNLVRSGSYLRAKVYRISQSLISIKTHQSLWYCGLSKTVLALAYVLYHLVRCSLHLKVKVHKVGLDIHRVQKLHTMSLVIQTCWNDLGLNLCIVPSTSHMVTISEDGLVRSYKERSKAHRH